MSTRVVRADAARNTQRILEAGRAALREHGPSVPYYTIAATAGLGQATLYRHFRNKDALVRAIVEENTRVLEDASRAIRNDGGRFEQLLEVLIELIVDNVEVALLMNTEAGGEWYESVIARITDIMHSTLTAEDPHLDDEDLRILLQMLSSSVVGASVEERSRRGERALRMLLAGVARRA